MAVSYKAGIDSKGRLICQEENLEPSLIKELASQFVTVTSKFQHSFTLGASVTDQQVSLGTITNAKVLMVWSKSNITIKLNAIGSSAIPCNPYALILAENSGIQELYLTNLGTATDVVVFAGA